MTLHTLTLTELSAGLAAKKFSSREIVDALLGRIAKANGKLHAFTEVYADAARAMADGADRARAAGFPLPPLHGLPIAYKDLCDIAGKVGTGGSKMFEKRVATETSNTVERLTAAGMVPLGKLHMVEFAFGGWGTNPLMGAPWNPWDLKTHRVPGGSSSGTGVAVAARLTPAGIGSDTGGSVRIPSAFNGLVGLKVTFGRIGLSGTMLLSWTSRFDRPDGALGRGLRADAERARRPRPARSDDARPAARGFHRWRPRPGSIEGMRIAMPDTKQLPELHACRRDQGLADGGADVRESRRHGRSRAPARLVLRPLAAAGTIIASEAYSLHRDYIEDMSKAIGPGVRGRAQAAKTFAARRLCRGDPRAWPSVAGPSPTGSGPTTPSLMPTMAVPAIPLSEVDETSPIPGYLTRPGNYLGLCSLAMPSGQSGGLPVGIQIVGKPFAETRRAAPRQGLPGRDGLPPPRPDLSALGL